MKLTSDREAAALYLDGDRAPAAASEAIARGRLVDGTTEGKGVGIAMLDFSRRGSAPRRPVVEIDPAAAYAATNPGQMALVQKASPHAEILFKDFLGHRQRRRHPI